MDIISLYNDGRQEREEYLQNAELLANVTCPWIRPRGKAGNTTNQSGGARGMGYESLDRPYSNAGTDAIGKLAATEQSILLPPGADWFELTIPLDIQNVLDPQVLDMARSGTTVLKQKLIDKMAEHGLYAESGPALVRLAIEGQFVFHVTQDELRVLPLRSFVVKRCNGKLEYIVIEEEIDSSNNNPVMLYTHVDYKSGKVSQQKTGQKDAKKVKADPKQYIVVTDMVPQLNNYVIGYGWRYYSTIFAINKLSRDMQNIITKMSMAPILIRPGADVTPNQFIEQTNQGKDVFSAIPEDFNLLALGREKGGDLQWMMAEKNQLIAELRRSFLEGIFPGGDPTRDRVTATEIMQRSQEADSGTQSICSTLMQTMQKPLVEAYMLIENAEVKINGHPGIRPVILAGSNKLSKLVQVNGLLSALTTAASLDKSGTFVQRIDLGKLFIEIAQAQGLVDAARFLLPEQQQQQGMPPGTPMA